MDKHNMQISIYFEITLKKKILISIYEVNIMFAIQ